MVLGATIEKFGLISMLNTMVRAYYSAHKRFSKWAENWLVCPLTQRASNGHFEHSWSTGVLPFRSITLAITLVGASLDLLFDPKWDDSFIAKVYHLNQFVQNNGR